MKFISIVAACLVALCAPSSGQEPKNPPATPQATSLAEERRELAEIQLLLGADRKYAEAKERLAKLAESLARRTDAGAKALLGEVKTLEKGVRRALGEPVAEELSLLVDVGTRQPGDAIDEAVLAALSRNDGSFVNELGARAGPGLAEAVRREPDTLPGLVAGDPLLLLLQLDPRRGDEFLREMLEHDGFFWRKRVVRALGEANPWGGKALFSTEVPRRWLGTGIQATLEKYASDPDVGRSALSSLGHLANAGSPSPEFPRLIAEALRSSDAQRRDSAKVIARNGTFAVTRPILEAALDEGDADLRSFASSVLSKHPESRLLLAHADDPEPEVRKDVLRYLGRVEGRSWGRAEHDVLAKLLLDDDGGVRESAWKMLRGLPADGETTVLPAERGISGSLEEFARDVYAFPLPDEVYRALLRRPEAGERSQLASIAARLPEPLCFELCAALAGDPDASVRSATAEVLRALPSWSDPEATLRIVGVLHDDAPIRRQGPTWEALSKLTRTRAGLVALARWIIERNEVDLVDLVGVKSLASIDPGPFADFAAWRFERGLFVSRQEWLRCNGPGMRELAEDPARPLVLRLYALEAVCEGRSAADESLAALVERVLADPGWRGLDQQEWRSLDENVHKVVSCLFGVERNRAIAAMLDNAALPEWLSVYAISVFDRRAESAAAIGMRVLERWFAREDEHNSAVRETIEAMTWVPELRDDRILAEATRRNAYSHTAWDTIAALKDPAFLPLIRSALEETGEPKAAEALFGYLSDDAAELLLLAAARVRDTELRDRCLVHLEKIREYQDSRERWATRKVKTATREQVLAQLVEQLAADSDDVKVQAIRALATWEAVEVMPKLIALTTSRSKSVAAAAREALERLNAPKKD